jgi:hypothetical protein
MERPLTLAPATWSALEHAARTDATTVAAIIADAVNRELYRRTRARKAVRPDERLIAPLRVLLADDFAYARDWDDLAQRLRAKGYAVLECGPGLILADAVTEEKLCKASDLGYSLARLTGRFGKAFPGHLHAHVTARFRLAQPHP